jgi:hypothetical protein
VTPPPAPPGEHRRMGSGDARWGPRMSERRSCRALVSMVFRTLRRIAVMTIVVTGGMCVRQILRRQFDLASAGTFQKRVPVFRRDAASTTPTIDRDVLKVSPGTKHVRMNGAQVRPKREDFYDTRIFHAPNL